MWSKMWSASFPFAPTSFPRKWKTLETLSFQGFCIGGDKRDRTADLLNAIRSGAKSSHRIGQLSASLHPFAVLFWIFQAATRRFVYKNFTSCWPVLSSAKSTHSLRLERVCLTCCVMLQDGTSWHKNIVKNNQKNFLSKRVVSKELDTTFCIMWV